MQMILLGALATLASPAQASGPRPAEIDLNCYRAMAVLARQEDPQARSVGLAAAAYFLGRIDAAAPGFDVGGPDAAAPQAGQAALVAQCSAILADSGLTLRPAAAPDQVPGAI